MSRTKTNPLASTIQRLEDSLVLRGDRWISWVVAIGFGILAFGIRIVHLSRPEYLIFDETYYAKDAYSLLHYGYEVEWNDDANDQIVAGNFDAHQDTGSFIVHPQLGKWLIALGIRLFGMNSFGWRIAAVVFGSLMVIATVRLARRLSRSTLVGAIAGLLLVFDGLHFVLSRIALLDIFQATFAVIAVACMCADRDYFRTKLASYLRANNLANLKGAFGPLVLWRPWRLLAGVFFGASIASKWNSLYVLAAFGVMSVVYDLAARRDAGAGKKSWRSLFIDAPMAFIYLVVVSVVEYFASWASWLATSGGYDRTWGANHPDDFWVKLLGAPLGSLIHYQLDIYDFHTGDWIASQTHTYQAHPAGWPVIGRTIGIDAVNGIQPGSDGCTATDGDTCLRVISGMGTPILWWLAAIAIVAGLIFWIFGRDWRFAIPVLATLTPWIMWFPNADRPTFYFYAIMMIPFSVCALAMILGKILGPAESGKRRRNGAIIVGGVLVLVILNFWFIYPILTDELMTRTAWSLRMWFRSWI